MDKVRGGTPKTQESMCLRCRAAHVMHGLGNEKQVLCRAIGSNPLIVRFPVVQCSSFDDKALPPLYEMQNIAWIVSSRNRGPMGFSGEGRVQITVEPPNKFGEPSQPAPNI